MNPYTCSKAVHRYASGAFETRNKAYPFYRSRDVGALENIWVQTDRSWTDVSAEERAAVDNLARSRTLLKLKDSSVNLGQMYAERKQAARMIGETAINLAKCMTSLRTGDYAAAARAIGVEPPRRAVNRYRKEFNKDYGRNQSKAIANGWLGLQYGWKPLLSDIFGACEAIANSQYAPIRSRVIGKAKTVVERTKVITDANRITLTSVETIEYIRKYTVYFQMKNEVNHTMSAMGVTNPLLLVWELLPYSFVVDWFIPIGNYLSSFDATVGLDFDKGCATEFRRITTTRKWVAVNGNRFADTINGFANGGSEWVTVSRGPIFSFPLPGYPSFKNPVSLVHAANAIALLQKTFNLKK
jgi:hypothetical protein